MTALRLGSLFDGIGVFPLAAVRCGIEPIWASEIEKAPISITKRHFPDMAHLGDVTKLDGRDLPPVHIITFGSPCQNLSQIGNRKGLAGEKSSLFFQAIRIIREMREATNGLFPAIAVWENVMGAFSSNNRMDFRAVLWRLCRNKGLHPLRRFAAIPAHPQKQYTRRWRLYCFCGFYYPIREVIPIAIYGSRISPLGK